MRDLAAKFSISDRGLAKACAAAGIPVPERGYWNKFHAGKKVTQRPLPPRGVGKSNSIVIGGSQWSSRHFSDNEILRMSELPEPVFEATIDEVRQEVTKLVQKAPFPKKINQPHRLVARLLADDDVRRQKYLASSYRSSWDAPIFDPAFEKRRLRLLNALFVGLEYCGMKPAVCGKEARELSVAVGDQHVLFSLDGVKAKRHLERERSGYGLTARDADDCMYLSLSSWRHAELDPATWVDTDQSFLEDKLPEIAVELIVSAEVSFRQGEIRHREWVFERKAGLIEEERQRRLEAERQRKAHEAKLEKQRVDHLLGQATALHQATLIRGYVAAVAKANQTSPAPMSDDELLAWRSWALTQADRIDPIVSGSYKTRPTEK